MIFYFHPYLGAFWELFFIFSRLLKQIQVNPLDFVEVSSHRLVVLHDIRMWDVVEMCTGGSFVLVARRCFCLVQPSFGHSKSCETLRKSYKHPQNPCEHPRKSHPQTTKSIRNPKKKGTNLPTQTTQHFLRNVYKSTPKNPKPVVASPDVSTACFVSSSSCSWVSVLAPGVFGTPPAPKSHGWIPGFA